MHSIFDSLQTLEKRIDLFCCSALRATRFCLLLPFREGTGDVMCDTARASWKFPVTFDLVR